MILRQLLGQELWQWPVTIGTSGRCSTIKFTDLVLFSYWTVLCFTESLFGSNYSRLIGFVIFDFDEICPNR